MPIFEYRCSECEREFERLVFSSSATVRCPECGSESVERRPSRFATSGSEGGGGSSCSGCSASTCAGCSSA